MRPRLVVAGGSAGALEVFGSILASLPKDFSAPVVIVIHLPAAKPSYVAELLGVRCRLPVKEAENEERISAGTVYVAPPNYHLIVQRDRSLALSTDDPLHFSRPAIDALFESAADTYGAEVAAVLLTGASKDGARGLDRIARLGGLVIVQSPATAALRTMPEAALRRVPARATQVLHPREIGPCLVRACATEGTSSSGNLG
jgi:two-component system chemotaxis response regulator CheB